MLHSKYKICVKTFIVLFSALILFSLSSAYAFSPIPFPTNGKILMWGRNDRGQVGDTSIIDRNTPIEVDFPNAKQVDTSALFTLALKNDGTVWAWGGNNNGQLGDGGTAEIYASQEVLTDINGDPFNNVIAVSAGENFSLALKNDGTVWTWGSNYDGQLGLGTHGSSSSDTSQDVHRPSPVSITNVVAIAGGSKFSLALKDDGSVWSWGEGAGLGVGTCCATLNDTPTQVGGGTPLTGISTMRAGYDFAVALKTNGDVWSWGYGPYGQLGNGSSGGGAVAALPVQVSISNVAKLFTAEGSAHVFALKNDGTFWSWGNNISGQMGNASNNAVVATPILLNETGVTDFSTGINTSMIIKDDGSIWTAGDDFYGQLGDGQPPMSVGSNVFVEIIQPLPPSETFIAFALAAGSTHGAILSISVLDVPTPTPTAIPTPSNPPTLASTGGNSAINLVIGFSIVISSLVLYKPAKFFLRKK